MELWVILNRYRIDVFNRHISRKCFNNTIYMHFFNRQNKIIPHKSTQGLCGIVFDLFLFGNFSRLAVVCFLS